MNLMAFIGLNVKFYKKHIYNVDAHKRLIDFHTKNTDNRFLYIGDYQSETNSEGLETIKLNFLHFDRDKILENKKFYEDRI